MKITHEQFIEKNFGKGFSEGLGFQCVKGTKVYSSEVFGVTIGHFSGTAYNGWLTGSPFVNRPFVRIWNSRTFIPKKGDIMFFAPKKKGGAGHVGICHTATMWTTRVLSQNQGNGNGEGSDDTFSFMNFNYISPKFVGVFRYIGQ